jgi:hypothetical protein
MGLEDYAERERDWTVGRCLEVSVFDERGTRDWISERGRGVVVEMREEEDLSSSSPRFMGCEGGGGINGTCLTQPHPHHPQTPTPPPTKSSSPSPREREGTRTGEQTRRKSPHFHSTPLHPDQAGRLWTMKNENSNKLKPHSRRQSWDTPVPT